MLQSEKKGPCLTALHCVLSKRGYNLIVLPVKISLYFLVFQEQIILNLTDVKALWINKYNKYNILGGWFC